MDDYTRALRNTFVSDSVDRLHQKRGDAVWLEAALNSPETRFFLLVKDSVFTTKRLAPQTHCINANTAASLIPQATTVILLGYVQSLLYFALVFEKIPDFDMGDGQFNNMRDIASNLGVDESALLAQAKGMMEWHRQNQYCNICGSPTNSTEAGYLRVCTNADCKHLHFPRTDPAVIVRVTKEERCLLGRQAWWAKGRYSNIAGFVEPGESLETAVAREVWEETGIRLKIINYHSSQPWPFPRSLMLGFTASAVNYEIKRNDGELEDARWFTREQLKEGLLDGTISMPSAYSISFNLIEDWFNEGDCGSLSDLIDRVDP